MRARIVSISARLFWEKGYAATTTREIAASLGFQKASLYHHIERKDDLLYAICTAALDDIGAAVTAAVASKEGAIDRVRSLIHAHVGTMVERRYEHATMLTELRALSPERRHEVVLKRDGYEQIVQSVLLDAQKAKALRTDIPVAHLRLGLLNLLNWSIFWYRPEGALSATQVADLLFDLFTSGARFHGNDAGGSDILRGTPARRKPAGTRTPK